MSPRGRGLVVHLLGDAGLAGGSLGFWPPGAAAGTRDFEAVARLS
jgi:hypothetical protein